MALVQHTTECSTNNLGCIAGTQHIHWDSQGKMICEELGDTISLMGCGIVIPEKNITPTPCLEDNACDPCSAGGCCGEAASDGGETAPLTEDQIAQVAADPAVIEAMQAVATNCTAEMLAAAPEAKA